MYGLMLRIWLSDEQIGLHLHRRPLLYFCSVFKYSLALQPHLPTVLGPRRFLLDAAHQDVCFFKDFLSAAFDLCYQTLQVGK